MNLHYRDETVDLWQADVLAWALWYKGEIDAGRAEPFHAIVTDPPYGLSDPPPIEKVLTAWLADGDFDYKKSGFMGKSWDNLPPSPRYWRAMLDITYPGGYLFAFSGTRTADLLGISCRLGGWEPFDRITNFAWVQGQGMKKGADVGKALDKEAGAERKVIATVKKAHMSGSDYATHKGWARPSHRNPDGTAKKTMNITTPATELAKQFDGYGTGIAPKHEPILLFRRPRAGRTFAQCAREFGSGGLNVDGCRVGHTVESWPQSRSYAPGQMQPGGKGQTEKTGAAPAGRWPPNTHFSHSPPTDICPTCNGEGCDECHGVGMVGGCVRVGSKRVKGSNLGTYQRKQEESQDTNQEKGWGFRAREKGYTASTHTDPDGREEVADFICVDGCAVARLDEMAGERPSSGRHGESGSGEKRGLFNMRSTRQRTYFDSGNCSRFYPNHDWSLEIAERLAGETPFRYYAKASRGERDAGLGDFPETTECLTNLQGIESVRRCPIHGASIPSGSNHYACGCKIIRHNVSQRQPQRNTGPCVKPLSLAKWLTALCRPPAQFKPRILIPYAGSGSEAIGAILAGWSEVHAIERELEYCEIAAARIAWWSKWYKLSGKDNPAKIRKLGEAADAREANQNGERQTSIFDFLKEV